MGLTAGQVNDIAYRIDQLLALLCHTSPEHEVWQSLPRIIERLVNLGMEKASARNAARARARVKEQLDDMLGSFLEHHRDRLSFHELAGTTSINPQLDVDAALMGEAARLLGELGNLLELYSALDGESPSSVSRRRELRQLQAGIKVQVQATYQRLHRLLHSGYQDISPVRNQALPSPSRLQVMPASPAVPEPRPVPAIIPGVQGDSQSGPDPGQAAEAGCSLLRPGPAGTCGVAPAVPGETVVLPGPGSPSALAPARADPPEPAAAAARLEPAAPATGHRPGETSALGPRPEALGPVGTGLWRQVAAGGFATAYWMSFCSSEPAVPPWVLKAAHLASVIRFPGDEAARELAAMVRERPSILQDLAMGAPSLTRDELAMLTALISLRPALLVPETGCAAWLAQAGAGLPGLQPVMEPIAQLLAGGLALDLGTLRVLRRERAIQSYAAEAAQWLNSERNCNLGNALATSVMHALASGSSAVGAAAEVVAGDRREDCRVVQEVLSRQLASRRDMLQELHTLAASLPGMAQPRIPGHVAEALLSRLDGIHHVMQGWVDALALNPGDTRKLAALEDFMARFREGWSELCTSQAGPGLVAGALWQALGKQLQEIENLLLAAVVPGSQLPGEPLDSLRLLRAPLLLLDELPLDEQGATPSGLSPRLAQELVSAVEQGAGLEAALERHVERRDFWAADLVLAELGGSPRWDDLVHLVKTRRRSASEAFRLRLGEVRRELERAVLDQVMTAVDRAQVEGELLGLELSVLEPDGNHRYQFLDAQVDRIHALIQEHRQHRAAEPGGESAAVQDTASTGASIRAHEYRSKGVAALTKGDLTLADEYFTVAEGALRGEAGPLRVGPGLAAYHEFERFKGTLPALLLALEEDGKPDRKRARTRGVLRAGAVDGGMAVARQQEIDLALYAFNTLQRTRDRTSAKDTSKNWVSIVLAYLGFRSPDLVRRAATSRYWHYSAAMSDGGLAPLPHFGSLRKGRYDVLVAWDCADAEDLFQLVLRSGLAKSCPVILVMDRMTLRQREEWAGYCQHRQLTALVVDEALLHYLTSVKDHRLPACIACSIPWGYANPYELPGGSLLAPEMFRGRSQFINTLVAPGGTGLLVGERQSGKSALLAAIEREFHRPPEGRYVFFYSAARLNHAAELWPRLRAWALDCRLLDPDTLGRDANPVHAIRRALEAGKATRVIAALDDGDRLLQMDEKNGFFELGKLLQLMEATGRRFKTLLAGTGTIQNYCSQPGHPLGTLGDPLSLGPLEAAEARALLCEPMQALGFRFGEDHDDPAGAIHRILVHTRNHPALIQHFCAELLRRRRGGAAPYLITSRHVDEVFHSAEVQRLANEVTQSTSRQVR